VARAGADRTDLSDFKVGEKVTIGAVAGKLL
jgi:hypothetical protein